MSPSAITTFYSITHPGTREPLAIGLPVRPQDAPSFQKHYGSFRIYNLHIFSMFGILYNILKDYGPNPFVINIEEATKQNNYFRIALWTGKYFQLTLMSINVGEDIGLEMHPDVDQFIRIEQGQGCVKMGDRKDLLDFQANVRDDYAIIIPAGKWHNLINKALYHLNYILFMHLLSIHLVQFIKLKQMLKNTTTTVANT